MSRNIRFFVEIRCTSTQKGCYSFALDVVQDMLGSKEHKADRFYIVTDEMGLETMSKLYPRQEMQIRVGGQRI